MKIALTASCAVPVLLSGCSNRILEPYKPKPESDSNTANQTDGQGQTPQQGTAADSANNSKNQAAGHAKAKKRDTSRPKASLAIAAAALALAGGDELHGPNRSNKTEEGITRRRNTPPPDHLGNSDWSVYNKVHHLIPNNHTCKFFDHWGGKRAATHAECSMSVYLAVRWSGADDTYNGGNTKEQYEYMSASSKWENVGTWNRKTGEGVQLQPGDILIGTRCSLGPRKTGHIFIFIGNELAQRKVPGTKATIFESAEADYWPYLAKRKAKSGPKYDYFVFRATAKQIAKKSRYRKIMPDERTRYLPQDW